MERINVNKRDEVTLVAEKIIDSGSDDIVLNVPRFSKLADSPMNFRLIKREAEAMNKNITVESVDDKVIELCKKVDLACSNPFFQDSKKQFSDIIVGKKLDNHKGQGYEAEIEEQEDLNESHSFQDNNGIINKGITLVKAGIKNVNFKKRKQGVDSDIEFTQTVKKKWFSNKLMFVGSVFVFIVLALFLGLGVLPKANITLVAAKTNWNYKNVLSTDFNIKSFDSVKNKIAGQVFVQKRNIQLSFPASSRRKVETKAKGKITIYNAHSSAAQALVATTRFETPDGKIFRIPQKVIVPGAKILNGKIIPSSIDVEVVADRTGDDYNIGPVKKFTIPGFKGSEKFDTFYAESKDSMTGGFIGETAFPNDEEIDAAKKEAASVLEKTINALILAQLPKEFKLLDGATRFKILKQEIDYEASQDDKFSIFTEAETTITVFREEDLLSLLNSKLKDKVGDGLEMKEYKLEYNSLKLDSEDNLSFEADYETILAKPIDVDLIKKRIAGKSEPDLKAAIFSVSGLESVQLLLWPFWVNRVPRDLDKINITVD